jgi:2-polyprenyl-6-methoxyphenol hydroxylase-like FAD-dependent oxidoreductase
MMLGYLLARRGVQVTVLEKHRDFFRDFRGDTVHPSTLEVLKELGLLKEFLDLPHEEVTSLGVIIGDSFFDVADFRHVPVTCKFVALMPQWDFLNFLSDHAKRFPSFQLLMEHEATDLIREGERITGVVAQHEGQAVRVHADLVVGCDGRHSITRRAAGMHVIEHGVPVDVLWFRISRKPDDPAQVLGNANYGKALILISRSDYFQAGLIIAKGSYDEIRAHGLDAFRAGIRKLAPYGASSRAEAARASNTCYSGDPDSCSSRLSSRLRKPWADPSSLAGEVGFANSRHSSRNRIRGGDRHAPGACPRKSLDEAAVPSAGHDSLCRSWNRGHGCGV